MQEAKPFVDFDIGPSNNLIRPCFWWTADDVTPQIAVKSRLHFFLECRQQTAPTVFLPKLDEKLTKKDRFARPIWTDHRYE